MTKNKHQPQFFLDNKIGIRQLQCYKAMSVGKAVVSNEVYSESAVSENTRTEKTNCWPE